MAEVTRDTIERWWYETSDYSWESLRSGLYRILQQNVISRQLYQDLRWAVNKLEDLGVKFPTSANELYQRVDYYL